MPGFDYDAWFGLMAAALTPKAILDKVAADVADVVANSDLSTQFAPQGFIIETQGPAAFAAVMAKDAERFAKLLEGKGG